MSVTSSLASASTLRTFLLLTAFAFAACAPVAVVATAPTPAARETVSSVTVDQRVAPEPRGRPVVVVAATPEPTATPTAAPVAVTTAAAPVAAAPAVPVIALAMPCPATWFCYPRLGVAGPIVSYDDCSGATDVGLGIRQLTCIGGGIWLAGHAYTQFGRIVGFRIGDVVAVRGLRFEITASEVHHACEAMTGPVAPLSLQTSLDANRCGRVLVVQGR